MTDKTITLQSELVERLETLAQDQGRTVDEVLGEILEHYPPTDPPIAKGNWALAVAEGMEAADIDWHDEPEASTRSRQYFEQHMLEKWYRTQTSEGD
jgi:predicted transcriptional regulator